METKFIYADGNCNYRLAAQSFFEATLEIFEHHWDVNDGIDKLNFNEGLGFPVIVDLEADGITEEQFISEYGAAN